MLVPRTPLLPPPTGKGSSGSDCVFMCITCNGCTGATQSSLQVNVQAVPGRAETPLSSAHLLAAFLQGQEIKEDICTQVSCRKRQGQCKEKQNGKKYSRLLFWQMATLAFWTLMGKTNVINKETSR